MNKVVAIVGMAGSGKSTAAGFFEKSGYARIRFGDVTMDELMRRGLAVNEENESVVRETLRIEQGMDAYAKLNEPMISAASKKGNVVIDGLYSWQEYIYLKPKFPGLLLLTVYASPKTRYMRLSGRSVRPLSDEEANERDRAELENLNKGGPIAMSDFTIINEGALEDLQRSVSAFIRRLA
ncbi:AAA family ATPase [Candidatus Woesearchaeota archaeon]|nr:AAA family ATPase [Candidatus Woesearchaeota archaeon]